MSVTESTTTDTTAEVTFWRRPGLYVEQVYCGRIIVNGVAFDFTATRAEVQPVPDDDEIHSSWNAGVEVAIDQEHAPAMTKEDEIVRMVIDRFAKSRPATAGSVWGQIMRRNHLSDRIDDTERHEWRLAFDTTWRKLKQELSDRSNAAWHSI